MKILILLSFLLLDFILNAQSLTKDNAQPQEIDFKNLKHEYIFKVPYNKPVNIKIINLNRFIYKVESSKTEENFNIITPSIFNEIKLPQFIFNLPSTTEARLIGLPSPGTRTLSVIGSEIQEYVNHIMQSGNFIYNSIKNYNKNKHIARKCELSSEQIMDMINTNTQNLVYGKFDKSISRNILAKKLEDTILSQYNSAINNLKELTKSIDEYKKLTSSEITLVEKEISELDRLLQTRTDPSEINKLKEKKESLLKAKNERINNYNISKQNLEENLNKANEIVESIKDLEKEDKLFPLYHEYIIYSNLKNYEYQLETIYPNKDEINISVIITSEELNGCDKADKNVFKILLQTKGGLKIDASSGIFINGGGSDFFSNTYFYENTSPTERRLTKSDQLNNNLLSIGSLVHLHFRCPTFFNLGVSAGASTTSGFEEFNFHVGPSLFIGNNNRLIITYGLTLKSSKILDQRFKVDQVYHKDYSPDEIPTIKIFPIKGWFWGVTYNLNVLKKS